VLEAVDQHGVCICEPPFPRGTRHHLLCDHDPDLRAAPSVRGGRDVSEPRRHIWTTDDNHDYEWCRVCLLVRQRNGSTDTKPCKGPSKIALRAAIREAE
jgi:hypothetical protein